MVHSSQLTTDCRLILFFCDQIIVLRDSPKAPILSWSLSEVLPPHREGHFRWIQLNHGTCRAKGSRASANSEDISSSSSSSWRLGGGQGGDACKYTFTLDVDGAETVDIAVRMIRVIIAGQTLNCASSCDYNYSIAFCKTRKTRFSWCPEGRVCTSTILNFTNASVARLFFSHVAGLRSLRRDGSPIWFRGALVTLACLGPRRRIRVLPFGSRPHSHLKEAKIFGNRGLSREREITTKKTPGMFW